MMKETAMNNFGAVGQGFNTQFVNEHGQANPFAGTSKQQGTFVAEEQNPFVKEEQQNSTESQCEQESVAGNVEEEETISVKEWIKGLEPKVMKYTGVVGLLTMIITSALYIKAAVMGAQAGELDGIVCSVLSIATLLVQIIAFIVGRIGFWKNYIKEEKEYDYKKNVLPIILHGISSLGVYFVSPVLMAVGCYLTYNMYRKEGLLGKELWTEMFAGFAVAVVIAGIIKVVAFLILNVLAIILVILLLPVFLFMFSFLLRLGAFRDIF